MMPINKNALTLQQLNGLSAAEAQEALLACCGSLKWSSRLEKLRPFSSFEEFSIRATQTWFDLNHTDWLEAFGHHPRIGDRVNASSWNAQEQSEIAQSEQAIREELRIWNEKYEKKFGHVFLISATGKSAKKMLTELKKRYDNEAVEELRNAAIEQAKITQLRLERLLAK